MKNNLLEIYIKFPVSYRLYCFTVGINKLSGKSTLNISAAYGDDFYRSKIKDKRHLHQMYMYLDLQN